MIKTTRYSARRPTALALTLAGAVLIALPALAQTAPAPTAPAPAAAPATAPASPRQDWAERFLQHLDTGHKGYITWEDAQRYAGERFDRLDRNHDGALDRDEFVAPLQRVIDRATPEQKPRLEQALARRDAAFKALDPSGTGKVTKEAYLADVQRRFATLDLRKDGKITLDELRSAHHAF